MTIINVRPADCDAYGHVNNAVYISYIEFAFTDWLRSYGIDIGVSWRLQGEDAWHPADIAVHYTRPAYVGQTLETLIWMEELHQEKLTIGTVINHAGAEQVLTGRITWRRVDRATGELLPLPPEMVAALSKSEQKPVAKIPHLQKVPQITREVPTFRSQYTVRRSEIATGDWAHPVALFHWIEEAVYLASNSMGWPAERILAGDMVILQHRHDLEIYTMPRREEVVDIVSRVVDARRVRGTWQHDLYRHTDGVLLAQNWSTGVFMTRDGRPKKPPLEMLEDYGWGPG